MKAIRCVLAAILALMIAAEARAQDATPRHSPETETPRAFLRDVIERHNVTNTQALRRLQRHLLSTPAGSFSIKKLYDSLRSQGVPVGKDTLYEYLDHLQDAFLIRIVSMYSRSERQRMANPRKAYPIDPGLIPLYERSGRENEGRALETAVLLELERREYTVDYLKTRAEWEVDFIAERPGEAPLLIQVSLDAQADVTWEREVRSLASTGRGNKWIRESAILSKIPTNSTFRYHADAHTS